MCSDAGTSSLAAARPRKKPQTVSFDAFKEAKESERRSHFEPKAKRKKNAREKREDVLINVGLVELRCGEYKRVYGKTFPVKLPKEVGYKEALELSLKKWEDYNRSFDRSRGYVLTYPDGQLARTVPGTEEDFTLKRYKDGLGKPYSRIILLLAPTLQLDEKRNVSIVDMLNREDDDDIESEGLENDDLMFPDDVNDMESVDDVEGAIDEHYTSASVNTDSVPFVVTDFLPVGIDENDAVRQAINNSLSNIQHDDDLMERTDCPSTTSTENFLPIIKEFANDKIKGDHRNIVVSRLSTWSTAQPYFRKSGFLNNSGMLSVTFASFEAEEDAADLGGPRREFFHLLLGGIACESGSLTSRGLFINV